MFCSLPSLSRPWLDSPADWRSFSAMDRTSIFTFIGVRRDGVAPVMELAACLDLTQAQFKARLWVRSHQSCEAVEIWQNDELLWRESVSEASATA